MSGLQVRCISKQPRNDTHHGLTHIGGNGWKLTRDQAIHAIKAQGYRFYTMVGGHRAEVDVVTEHGRQYLRTRADGYYNDNLLALPECAA